MVIRSSVTPRKVNRSYMLISSSPRTRSVSQSRAPDDPTMMWARRYRSNGAPQPGASGRDVRGGLGRLRPATDDQEDDGDGDRRDRGRDQCGGEWETDERGADQVGKRTGVHRPEHTADRRPQQEGAIRIGGEPERGTGHDADAGHVATEGQQDGRARADHPEGGRDALTLHRRVETRLETSAIEPDDPVQRGVTHDGSSRAGQHDQRQLQVATGGEGRGSVERRLTRQQCADRVAETRKKTAGYAQLPLSSTSVPKRFSPPSIWSRTMQSRRPSAPRAANSTILRMLRSDGQAAAPCSSGVRSPDMRTSFRSPGFLPL